MFSLRPLSVALMAGLALANPLHGQDLEPRAYAAAPVGLHFLIAGAVRSSGDVLVDPSLPFSDVHAIVGAATAGGGTVFSLFGRTALLAGAVPIVRARASGRIGEAAQETSRAGLGDPRVKLSVNLLGGRAVGPAQFAKSPRPTIIGTSIVIAPPVGQYHSDKLVNLGANRWAFKPEVGISKAIREWTIDFYSGVWLFTSNGSFYPGTAKRTQDPVLALQGHSSYTFRPQLWLAFDATFYTGGRTAVDGADKGDLQRNSRVGVTLSLPLTRSQSVKVAYSTGATTRVGGDFNTVGVVWQMGWLTLPRAP